MRDRVRLIANLIMSLFFLFIFSFIMKSSMAGLVAQPMNYLVSGVIIMTVFQSALNNSMDILNDISSGFMKEILVAPISRWQISIGQMLSSSVIAVTQGLLMLVVGLFMGLSLDVLHFVEIVGVMAIAAVTFGSLGLFLATAAKSSVRFQMIITIIMLPLTFLSGAMIPTTVMPAFLRPIVYINPLTYITSAFRYVAMQMEHMGAADLVKVGVAFKVGSFTIMPPLGLVFIAAMGLVFLALCVWKFNRADFSTVKTFHHDH
jgi:ABC-2 type transport system permease protein